jgi:hypothetical protein
MEWWLRPCENVDAHIRWFEEHSYGVDGAEEFRKDWAQALELVRLLPATWRGQKVNRESELTGNNFPFAPEPE